jgi:hypothetical protein
MATKRTKRGVGRKKTNLSISDTKRKFDVPVTAWMRYKNPIQKGILWYLFSIAIRKRDVAKYGTCISCGKRITVETSDCGHFIPAASCGRDLLFNPYNNNAECTQCNAWDELHLFGYAKGLDNRYGVGTAEMLLAQHRHLKYMEPTEKLKANKDFSAKEYEEKITHLKLHGL